MNNQHPHTHNLPPFEPSSFLNTHHAAPVGSMETSPYHQVESLPFGAPSIPPSSQHQSEFIVPQQHLHGGSSPIQHGQDSVFSPISFKSLEYNMRNTIGEPALSPISSFRNEGERRESSVSLGSPLNVRPQHQWPVPVPQPPQVEPWKHDGFETHIFSLREEPADESMENSLRVSKRLQQRQQKRKSRDITLANRSQRSSLAGPSEPNRHHHHHHHHQIASMPVLDSSNPSLGLVPLGGPQQRNRLPHNLVEQRYRNTLNAEIRKLQMAIPHLAELHFQHSGGCSVGTTQPTKATIIASAVKYIKQIESERDAAMKALAEMKAQTKEEEDHPEKTTE